MIQFTAHDHKYTSIEETDKKDWISATTFISQFKKPFEADKMAEKSARNRKSKWYGMTPEEIKAAWKSEAKRLSRSGEWSSAYNGL
jgi:hypothetical protein